MKASMKIVINAAALRDALATNVTQRSTLDILQHALLEAEGETLRITTTDMEKFWSVEIDATVNEAGRCTGKVDLLRAAVTGLEGGIELILNNEKLLLKCGKRRFNIPTLSANDFLSIGDSNMQPVDTDPVKLREAIGRVAYAIAKNNLGNAWMNGLLLDAGHCVAFNGFRMAICPTPLDVPETKNIIIPRDTVPYIINLLEEGAELKLVKRPESDNVVAVQVNSPALRTTLYSKLIDAKYSEWQKITPTPDNAEKHHTFVGADARAALTRVIPFCNPTANTKSIPINIESKGGNLIFSPPRAPDTADTIPCSTDDVQENIRMEASYLRDVLATTDDNYVTWHTDSPDSNVVFTVSGREDIHYIAPMRI